MTADHVRDVAAGYAFDGPCLDLGALLTGPDTVATEAKVRIPLGMLNRHGLVAGATGTGKTKTLQVLAEQLAAAGVPVFLADVKGDLSGIAEPGEANAKLTARAESIGQDWRPAGTPGEYYSLGGRGTGVPVRVTVTAFGPLLLSRVLDLNEVQESSLSMVFHFADEHGLPLLDLKDLRSVVTYLTSPEGAAELAALGGLSKQTAGVLLRKLVAFADDGAEDFFGEPEFDTRDLLRTEGDGRGVVSVLELSELAGKPRLFATFLMWLLADLYHDLPEVGDVDKPKLVFFFDEAHLLFDGASKAFLDSITQTVRLIRSKGVGVFFVTQTPKDVAPDVLGQLGNRVQHALRAYTPDDAKALRATVSTFPTSSYDLAELLTTLGIGEAVVTVLSETGAPTPVAWTRLAAPTSRMGPLDPADLTDRVHRSPLWPRYAEAVDRESAYEMLAARLAPAPDEEKAEDEAAGKRRPAAKEHEDQGLVQQVLGRSEVKSFLRSAASSAGREVMRSLFGTARRRR
ncbi:helicase HerA-like domain-containing protein [Actinocatenispora rupis]|uniref:ATPase n=1 Tax=Actinocatenispora rupis TaxID=519421 RepID=A0A8J3J771_9ACTN|nr:helicase HerA-like domain-containing protein [Actinocatenispora rupis]GID13262.1 ATPase [Actinocatenispora rupis]